MVSLPENFEEQSRVSLVSVPDGVDTDARTDITTIFGAMRRAIPGYVEDLILKINQSNENEKITCAIIDTSVGWVFEVVNKLGIEAVAIWPAGTACLALAFHVPQLLEAQIINIDGVVTKDEPISLSEDVPGWTNSEIGWKSIHPIIHKVALAEFYSIVPEFSKFYDRILCNTISELDSAALKLIPKPKVLPIVDQFSNKNYICDVLKIGLELTKDENGITTRHEISAKINTLLSSDVIKANALRNIKEIASKSCSEGGSSFNNFKSFIEHVKSL
ncbi:UDP-glycosyltransferase 83A1 [Corchorus olitorius]|uniref:UDP-glycosyltransferase 83A1 n=1 Tax=Corchorus olitorius TaxID=93759 RepID=A0A1R3G0U4_9ROSI|nr:UDP-glycosyltransferase 83A1 [Corchorus olitorius]